MSVQLCFYLSPCLSSVPEVLSFLCQCGDALSNGLTHVMWCHFTLLKLNPTHRMHWETEHLQTCLKKQFTILGLLMLHANQNLNRVVFILVPKSTAVIGFASTMLHNWLKILYRPLCKEGKEVNQVKSFKYLGVLLDECLSFNDHISYLRSKVASRLGLLSRLPGCLTTEAANKIYLSTVLPTLSYCDTCFCPLGSTNRMTLERLQRRAAKVV